MTPNEEALLSLIGKGLDRLQEGTPENPPPGRTPKDTDERTAVDRIDDIAGKLHSTIQGRRDEFRGMLMEIREARHHMSERDPMFGDTLATEAKIVKTIEVMNGLMSEMDESGMGAPVDEGDAILGSIHPHEDANTILTSKDGAAFRFAKVIMNDASSYGFKTSLEARNHVRGTYGFDECQARDSLTERYVVLHNARFVESFKAWDGKSPFYEAGEAKREARARMLANPNSREAKEHRRRNADIARREAREGRARRKAMRKAQQEREAKEAKEAKEA